MGVLVHEDVGPGSVLKQKGLIFFFSLEMAFLISWNRKRNVTKEGKKIKKGKKSAFNRSFPP